MKLAHQYWKMLVLAFVLTIHLAIDFVARFLLDGGKLRAFQMAMLQRNSRVALAVLGVDLTVEGEHHWRAGQNYVVVANHLSYLDTLLFAAFKPICFLSPAELKEAPFLGPLVSSFGAIQVERRGGKNLRREIREMQSTLADGLPVVLFPEGSSTNGSSVHSFQSPFFAPALRARVPILPSVVQLEELNGEKVTATNRDHLCWYGEMDLFPHLFALSAQRRAKITLRILPEIPVAEGASRRVLARRAQDAITSAYQPIT